MKSAKVFKSGNSQAVRIPKEFHLEGEEVEIRRKGGALILRPKKQDRQATAAYGKLRATNDTVRFRASAARCS